MSRIPYLIAGLVAALAVSAPTSAGMDATKLTGTVGPGYTISLKKGAAKVRTLLAGSYTITVKDKSKIHDFRLKGPGVNKVITSTPFKGTRSFTTTLRKGTYAYVCTPHLTIPSMKGTFRVT
jgi:hypothetical protein